MTLRMLVIACAALPAAALAQTDPVQMARVAGANQVGIMEYCQGQGWADQAAVEAQRASLAGLPPAADPAVAAAEAKGKAGSLLNNGTAMPLAAMASQTHTSEQALCGKLAESARLVAAQRSATPPIPAGMPGFPAGMPALPNGMTMPAFPGLPGVPKTQ